MKNFRFLSFAIVAIMAVSSTIYFNSCKTDPCKDVVCANGGQCIDGTCSCAAGYEGTTCETEVRAKIIAQYSVNENCTVSGPATYNVTIASISDVTKVTVTPFAGYPGCTATLTVSGTTLALSGVSGAPSGMTFSDFTATIGTGGTTITGVSYKATDATPSTETCTGTWTKL